MQMVSKNATKLKHFPKQRRHDEELMEIVAQDNSSILPIKSGAKNDHHHHHHHDDYDDDDGPQINQGTIFYLQQRRKMEQLSTN